MPSRLAPEAWSTEGIRRDNPGLKQEGTGGERAPPLSFSQRQGQGVWSDRLARRMMHSIYSFKMMHSIYKRKMHSIYKFKMHSIYGFI
jgi:hypothetical protein